MRTGRAEQTGSSEDIYRSRGNTQRGPGSLGTACCSPSPLPLSDLHPRKPGPWGGSRLSSPAAAADSTGPAAQFEFPFQVMADTNNFATVRGKLEADRPSACSTVLGEASSPQMCTWPLFAKQFSISRRDGATSHLNSAHPLNHTSQLQGLPHAGGTSC